MNSKNETHPAVLVMGTNMLAGIGDKRITAFRYLINEIYECVFRENNNAYYHSKK